MALSPLSDGRVVAVWDSRRQEHGTYGVFARLLDADGTLRSREVHVNAFTPGQQTYPAAAAGPDGSVWFAWLSQGQFHAGGSVVARRFHAGLIGAGKEIVLSDDPCSEPGPPTVAFDSGGVVLIAWSEAVSRNESGARIRIASLDASGRSEACVETLIGSGEAGVRDSTPTLIAGGPGSPFEFFLAFARSVPTAPLESRVLLTPIEATGRPPDGFGPIEVGRGGAIEPSLAVAADGTLAVAWLEPEASAYGVRFRRYRPDGAPGEPVRAVVGAGTPRSGVAAAFDRDAELTIAFNEEGFDEAGRALDRVRGVRADASGVCSPPFELTAQPGAQAAVQRASGAAHLAPLGGGKLALAWSGNSGQGDASAANISVISHDVGNAETAPHVLAAGAAPDLGEPGPIDPPVFDPRFVMPADPFPVDTTRDIDVGFEAVPGTGWNPPDPEMAVGPNHLVAICNGQIAFFDKAGNNSFRQKIEGESGFWASAGVTASDFVFDPEVMYDATSSRFFTMAADRANQKSWFLLAMSDDSDPNGVWYKWKIDVTWKAGNARDIDSPNLSVDGQSVYLTADFFTPNDKMLVLSLFKPDVLTANPVPSSRWYLFNGSQSFGVPIAYGAAGPNQYLIQSLESASNTSVRLHAVVDPNTFPTIASFDLSVPEYRFPAPPPQAGTSVRPTLFEPRFWSCAVARGSLWAVHHITVAGSAVTRVRWYEIDLRGWPASGGTPVLKQFGEVVPDSGAAAFTPGIAVDSKGNVIVVYARSSPNEFISSWRAVRRSDDPPGTLRDAVPIRANGVPDTSGRWGDYLGVKPDPSVPRVFWTHTEFNPAGAWRTWIGRHTVPDPADFNHDGVVDDADLFEFLNAFESQNAAADFDADGELNDFDYFAFLNAFNAAH
ncbi:MAG: hypothetical protein JNM07_07995 [Phycisphaerae bacterium]|nr:hypothetical protein [Phycisphaerae bacterium]